MEKHKCNLPESARPGDEYACPDCGRKWWADTDGNTTAVYIWWRTLFEQGN